MPDQPLRVLLVEGRPERASALARDLEEEGFVLAGVAGDGQEACRACAIQAPDLVLMASDLPGSDGVQTTRVLMAQQPLPVVLMVEREDRALLDRAQDAGVQSLLPAALGPAGLGPAGLGPALELAYRNFGRESRLAGEVAELREGLRQRKLLERAKGLLMEQRGLDEAAALARLEEMARAQGCAPHQAAEALVETQGLFNPARSRKTSRPA